jgi:hypothetical protein
MPPELFASDGSAPRTTSVGGVGAGCASGADVTGAGGANTAGAGGADDTSARWEWRYASTGCARPGGAQR